ncbi:GNAT family N-acetyltransferase [Ahrensia kielensis]|uniref:GNAT family N-acetyltransferase n=1 Tax=Ahrensia kielensis TaxID=76980 RepID=A0ABU9T4K1_9HYPH
MSHILENTSATSDRKTRTRAAFSVRAITDRQEALSYVDQLPDDVVATGYQSKIFLTAWLSNDTAKPLFLIFNKHGHGDVLLPLELQGKNVAIYCGESHANGNFPVGKRDDILALSSITIAEISKALRNLNSAADALFLERQHEQWDGIKNPFVFESSQASPNVALSLSLEGGFEGVQERHHGKRKRKRQRSHMRKLETFGTVRYVEQVPCHDVEAVLDAFFDMKTARFKELGLCDVFADQSVRNMFGKMFKDSCALDKPTHTLQAVYCDDEPAAIIGCTHHKGRQTVEFGTFAEKFADCGPGDLLFFNSIETACARGYDIYDFGVGDEFYKRRWCEIETWHRETHIPISAQGKLKTTLRILRGRIVKAVKTNTFIWAKVKTARKHVGNLFRR